MSAFPIERELQRVASRFRRRSLWRNLTLVWLASLLGFWILIATSRGSEPRTMILGTIGLSLVTALIVAVASLLRRFDLRWIAFQIERVYPDLETRLFAAFDQEQKMAVGERNFLEEAVIHEAASHARTHDHWDQTVSNRQLFAWSSVQWLSLSAVAATLLFAMPWKPAAASGQFADDSETSDMETVAEKPLEVEVEPGDVELERGADLLVLARFADQESLPREVSLLSQDGSGEKTFTLQQSLSDPVFAVRIPEVRRDLKYCLAFSGGKTRDFQVTVFDYPELERADAELHFPQYTERQPRRIEDVRQISLLEGTELRLECRLNKAVASAKLLPVDGEPISLVANAKEATLFTMSQVMKSSVRWRLELTDDRGRKNRQPVEFVIDVVPNRPPELKLVFPRKDLKVSPLQEVPLEAEVTDDFGIVRWGLSYELPGKKSETIVLGEKLNAGGKHSGQRLVSLEDLNARPDELLAWHVWAEDIGPDGKTRRSTSDIFFAEISPFEEIFREGESSSGEMPSAPAEAKEISEAAKSQKEIITATWNLRRRENSESPSAKYAADAQVIADSQQKLLEKMAALKEKLKSPDGAAIVAEIENQMQIAVRELVAAAGGNTLPPLDLALPAEQAAYQGLLKLRARETRVTRSKNAKSSSASSGQQSTNEQELDQLELKDEENRYETRNRAANAQQTPAQKEREQFLNRLRELARRQEDTNQKVKELQAALDAAKNEEDRKQLERQLKRLREEQRDLLRDVDQLKNQADKPEHNQPLAEASKKLDETRESVRQASDALEKGKVSQALAAGTRAENELDKLREDFRKQNANQFAGEVQDLLDRARQLEERQQKIGEQLAQNPATPKPPTKGGLRAPAPMETAKAPEQLNEQKKELHEVIEQARQITERAEGNEPLLSKQLYDTVRQAHQQQTERAVELMERLARAGLNSEAAKLEPQAKEGVKQLREGIEKAAQGVLGNDVEGLRRAKKEVDRLAQALAAEMPNAPSKQRSGRSPNQDDGEATRSDKADSSTQSRPGQPGEKPKDSKQQPNNQASGQTPAKNMGDKSGMPDAQGKSPGHGDKPSEDSPANSTQKNGNAPANDSSTKNGAPNEKNAPSSAGKPMSSSGQPMSPGGKPMPSEGKPTAANGDPMPNGSPSEKGSQPSEGQGQGKGSPMSPGKPTPGNQPGSNNQPMPGDPSNPEGSQQQTATAANRKTSGPHGVLTGADWREWSDSLRNIEEFVPGTRLRSEAARIREEAQAIRAEAKRHSKTPNWELVRDKVFNPLVELQRQLNEELLRRESPEAAVPLDRDPVPDRFGDAVRKYYERLGSGQ